jgi:hypothetical protein
MFARLFAGLALLAGLSSSLRADDTLKAQAAAAMKKADVDNARVVETEHLLVATALPEAKAKALANGLEKAFVQAARALKLEAADTKGQVTVFAFADVDHYRQFQRAVLKQRPDDDEYASFDVKRDDAYVAVSARRSEKAPNFEALAGTELCRALLARKAGNARLPEWMKDGFARAMTWRLNPASAGTDRAAVARLAPPLRKGAKGAMPVVDKAWSGTGKEKDAVAASLMDYFTSGPGAEKFGNVLSSLIPTDATAAPTFADALKAADWMVEDLDRSWREWVSKGSPATAPK